MKLWHPQARPNSLLRDSGPVASGNPNRAEKVPDTFSQDPERILSHHPASSPIIQARTNGRQQGEHDASRYSAQSIHPASPPDRTHKPEPDHHVGFLSVPTVVTACATTPRENVEPLKLAVAAHDPVK